MLQGKLVVLILFLSEVPQAVAEMISVQNHLEENNTIICECLKLIIYA
jgi:hypothetical protein